ncbi:GvpL/GvpF family gas vesicle protein [Streptomyces sp. NPDC001530]|uniref:GvpL/GvpF family gas vesicle protein n=1 Tax=Streptomyces sp. NPDC001530 TaxID=3364582 RepID=UPI003677B39A
MSGIRGVAGAPVTLVGSGSLAAAVSAVPERDFSEQALRVRLEDLEWLEAVARPHHAVIETLSAHTTVLPLRLATIYLDDAHVRDMLDAREEDFAGLLDRLADHVELGVKVYAEPPPDSEEAAPDEAPDDTSGRAYLQRRRQQRRTRDATWRAARDAVRRIQAEAREFAVDSARYRPQQGRLAEGAAGENVANEAYLVPRTLADEFRARVQESANDLHGVRVEVTGPWAPYSFAGRSA